MCIRDRLKKVICYCNRITCNMLLPNTEYTCASVSQVIRPSQSVWRFLTPRPSLNWSQTKTVFGETKIMLNRFIATCNVARWLCHWNLLFVCPPLHQQRDVEDYLSCGPSPALIGTWIFNIRAPRHIHRHVRTRTRTQNLRMRTPKCLHPHISDLLLSAVAILVFFVC